MSSAAVRTLLFTDLVGSTALSVSMPAAEADTLRRAHLALLRKPVAALGGDEVKNLGDGLMVAFSSPSRALACAVAMQRAVERHNRRGGPPVAVRIGVSGGEVSEEDGDYFGDPVVEAARLCAAAQGGQILVAATVRAMAGRNAPAALIEVGGHRAEGVARATGLPRARLAGGRSGGGIEDYETIPGWDSSLAVIYGEVGRFDEQRALVDAARVDNFTNSRAQSVSRRLPARPRRSLRWPSTPTSRRCFPLFARERWCCTRRPIPPYAPTTCAISDTHRARSDEPTGEDEHDRTASQTRAVDPGPHRSPPPVGWRTEGATSRRQPAPSEWKGRSSPCCARSSHHQTQEWTRQAKRSASRWPPMCR